MVVHVLVAVRGEDPPDVEVLGTYRSAATAERRKAEINANNDQYGRDIAAVADEVVRLLKEWQASLPDKFPNNSSEEWRPWQTLHDRLRYYVQGRYYVYGIAQHSTRREAFIREMEGYRAAVCKTIDLPPLPALPASVAWEGRGPLYSHYNMSIHESEPED